MTTRRATKRNIRRGNGEGAIYQRQETKRDGTTITRWCASVSLEHGKRKVLYGKSHDEVVQKLTLAMRDAQLGMPMPPERLTVERFLADWLANTVKPSRRAGTLLRFRGCANCSTNSCRRSQVG